MILTMFHHEYSKVIVLRGSTSKQFLLYKKLIDANDIDFDINKELTDNLSEELENYLNEVINQYNLKYNTNYFLSNNNREPIINKIEGYFTAKYYVKDPSIRKGNNEFIHFDIKLVLHSDTITIYSKDGINVIGDTIEKQIYPILKILSNWTSKMGRIAKDIKSLYDFISNCDDNGIDAGKLVALMKNDFYPRGKYDSFVKGRDKIKILFKATYNKFSDKEIDTILKLVNEFVKPLMQFEGENYTKWYKDKHWVKKPH